MRSRIFISRVAREFGAAREQVGEMIRRLGFEPDWIDIAGAEDENPRPGLSIERYVGTAC